MPHSHENSHEDHDMDEKHKNFWKGCSEKWWGDDEHEHAAKKIAFVSVIVVIIALIVIVTIIVLCCRRKAQEAARRRDQVKTAVVNPQTAVHPKAIEAYGPGGVPPPVCISVQGCDDGDKKDPRLTLGVWSPPPAYEEPK